MLCTRVRLWWYIGWDLIIQPRCKQVNLERPPLTANIFKYSHVKGPFNGAIKIPRPTVCNLVACACRWHALSLIFLPQLHCQSCKAISLQTVDLMPPMALIYATVVVLSDVTLICLTLRSLQKDSRPNNTAFISKKLMWEDFSPRLQSPPLRLPSQTAP